MKLKDSKTIINLAKSYAGECQARTRYEFIEYGARKEGYKTMAEEIDKVVYQEFNHARMFYSFIQTACQCTIDNIDIEAGYPFKEKWNLLDNLRFAAEDEKMEATSIYPSFAKTAREEGFEDIANLYENVIKVEESHRQFFEKLYNQLKNGTLYKKSKEVVWKCADCGYEHKGKEAFETCPLCQAKQGSVLLKLDQE